ncbi:MAG: prenyltransferase [Candidatus Microsaccharimonas sp.]
MIETIKKLALVSRPVSWVNTAYPFAAAFLVSGGQLSPTFFIATFYFLIPYNLLMYGVNDVFDYESDIRNPRKGGIEGMKEQRAFHPTILKAIIISNVPFVVYLLITGTAISNAVLLVLLFFVVAYSVAGLRFKEKPFLDSATSSIHFVGPLVYGLSFTQITAEALPIVVAFFLWGMASHAFGAVQDIIPDRKGKLSSIATFLGAQKTIIFCSVLYLMASILLLIQGMSVAIVGLAGLIYFVNSIMFINIDDQHSFKANVGWRRFIWLNLFVGFVVTVVLIYQLI